MVAPGQYLPRVSAPDRLPVLDDYLGGLAYRLGQKALWRVVYAGGEGKVVVARPPGNKQ